MSERTGHGAATDVAAPESEGAALLKAARRLEHYVRHSPLGIIEWNRGFECVAWSPAATRIFGYTEAEAVGRHAVGLILEEGDRPAIMRGWDRLLALGPPTCRVNENIAKGGRVILCEWFNAPIEGPGGAVIGVSSLVRDITEEAIAQESTRRVHAVLERRALDAEEDAREKERLAGRLEQELETVAWQQQQILALSAPVLEVWDGVIALPIIGALDARRGAEVMGRLLSAVAARRSEHVLLDLTGVEALDAEAAHRIAGIVRAVSLLGAHGIVTGLSPAAARAFAEVGVDLSGVDTRRSLREGLRACVSSARRRAGTVG